MMIVLAILLAVAGTAILCGVGALLMDAEPRTAHTADTPECSMPSPTATACASTMPPHAGWHHTRQAR